MVGAGIVHRGCQLGYGKPVDKIPPVNIPELTSLYQIVSTIYVFASAISKIAFGFTLLKLGKDISWLRYVVIFGMVTTALSKAVSMILPYVWCQPIEKTWMPWIEGNCRPRIIMAAFGTFSSGK